MPQDALPRFGLRCHLGTVYSTIQPLAPIVGCRVEPVPLVGHSSIWPLHDLNTLGPIRAYNRPENCFGRHPSPSYASTIRPTIG